MKTSESEARLHWLIRMDEDGLYGEVCNCPIRYDHDESERPAP